MHTAADAPKPGSDMFKKKTSVQRLWHRFDAKYADCLTRTVCAHAPSRFDSIRFEHSSGRFQAPLLAGHLRRRRLRVPQRQLHPPAHPSLRRHQHRGGQVASEDDQHRGEHDAVSQALRVEVRGGARSHSRGMDSEGPVGEEGGRGRG